MTQARTRNNKDAPPTTQRTIAVRIPRSERERAGITKARDRTGVVVRLGSAQLAEQGLNDKSIAEFFSREATRVKVAGFAKAPERATLDLRYEPASDREDA